MRTRDERNGSRFRLPLRAGSDRPIDAIGLAQATLELLESALWVWSSSRRRSSPRPARASTNPGRSGVASVRSMTTSASSADSRLSNFIGHVFGREPEALDGHNQVQVSQHIGLA